MKKTLLPLCFCLFALWCYANKTNFHYDGNHFSKMETDNDSEPSNAALVAEITFCVDVGCVADVTSVNIFGAFNGWDPNANPLMDNGGGMWCGPITMEAGNQE